MISSIVTLNMSFYLCQSLDSTILPRQTNKFNFSKPFSSIWGIAGKFVTYNTMIVNVTN